MRSRLDWCCEQRWQWRVTLYQRLRRSPLWSRLRTRRQLGTLLARWQRVMSDRGLMIW